MRHIVTMTTFPARVAFVPLVLESILSGTLKPDLIRVNLSREEFPGGTPEVLLGYERSGRIEVCWRDGNERAFKKLIPTLEAFPGDVVVSIDDDILYPSYFLDTITREIRANGYSRPVTCGHCRWKSWGSINSHYGGFTATMAAFYGGWLEELYRDWARPLALRGEARYDDELYTIVAKARGVRYQPSSMDLRPLSRERSLPGAITRLWLPSHHLAIRRWREDIRQQVIRRYGVDPLYT